MTFRLKLDPSHWMTINEFSSLLRRNSSLFLGKNLKDRLNRSRRFIDHLCSNKKKVYGITTGFGSLREKSIPPELSSLLSKNLILSHDAGIGSSLPQEVVLGAMILRAHSLSKDHSGFSSQGLETLTAMINQRIIPEVPSSGSLGASGDLAFLARLGHAMMGGDVPVIYQHQKMPASEALKTAKIPVFNPKAKEGLALTNGTSFMASMITLAYLKEEALLENIIGSIGIFLNAVGASKTAFSQATQIVRNQSGQLLVSQLLMPFFSELDQNHDNAVQDDYSIRCLPQIFGPRFEAILDQRARIEKEINAVTDNPLIFKDEEITDDVDKSLIYSFEGSPWAILSGGNFHGENLTTFADNIALANAKIALTLERQISFLLNSWRNKSLPDYLISSSENIGLQSGFMIPHYTANAVVHKICLLAQPSSLMNCTSANESEDIVSYGATACHKLLNQIELMNQLLTIYFLTCVQAYSIKRKTLKSKNEKIEEMFNQASALLELPIRQDDSFQKRYETVNSLLDSGKIREIIGFPLEETSLYWPATKNDLNQLEKSIR